MIPKALLTEDRRDAETCRDDRWHPGVWALFAFVLAALCWAPILVAGTLLVA